MKQPKDVGGSTRDQVMGLFQQILDILPAGCASLRVDPGKDADDFGVSVVPTNERSAEFGAMLFGSRLYSVDFGKEPTFTTFECPWEINLPRSAGLDRQLDVLAKMCLAVIAGRCEHRFERRSTRGVINVSEGEVYRVGDMHIGRLFRPRRNPEVLQYAPYYPGAATHRLSLSRSSL